jgi:hypothetical protein
MADDPVEVIYSMAERAYLRMQAEDILIRCLEEAHSEPLQRMVESLVIKGPENFPLLQEIIDEVMVRQQQLEDDLNQIAVDFYQKIREKGVQMGGPFRSRDLRYLTPARLLGVLQSQVELDEETQIECLQLLQGAREMAAGLNQQLSLLANIRDYLWDWMLGLAYELTHKGFQQYGKGSTYLL